MSLLAGVLDGPVTARTFIIPAWWGDRRNHDKAVRAFSTEPLEIVLAVDVRGTKTLGRLLLKMQLCEEIDDFRYCYPASYHRYEWYQMPWSWLEEGLLSPERQMGVGTYQPAENPPQPYYVTAEGVAAMQVLKDWLLEQGLIES